MQVPTAAQIECQSWHTAAEITGPPEQTVKTSSQEERSPQALIAIACDCLSRSYAPYSKLSVAAAVVDDDGRIFTGVNVENASYGLTMCAERVAIFNAIAAGAKKLRSLALVATSSAPVMPCGACRQVMAEFFDPSALVYSGRSTGTEYKESTVGELLPDAFGPDAL